MATRGPAYVLGPRVVALQGRLWWLLAGAGYGLGEWAMGHVVEPDGNREARIWQGIILGIGRCDEQGDPVE